MAADNTTVLDENAVAYPCGLIAKSFFNDTYVLQTNSGAKTISISETGISWPNDKGKKFKN
jgi:hypothetical protein